MYEIIQELKTTKGTNAKKAILEANKENADLKAYLRVVYEPTINYYITKLPENTGYGDLENGPVNLQILYTTLANLFKRNVTGLAAKQYIVDQSKKMNRKTFELFVMAIHRDIKAGVGDTTINKIWPGLVTMVPYMRCTLPKDSNIKEWAWGEEEFYAYSQIKADGMYANLNIKNDDVVITSRNGSVFPKGDYFNTLIQEAQILASKLYPGNTQLQGELLVKLNGEVLPREKSNGVMNSILQTGEHPGDGYQITMDIWDTIPLDSAVHKGKFELPYSDRYNLLVNTFQNAPKQALNPIENKVVSTFKEASEHFLDAQKRGLEGTILKHKDATWLDGDNKDQVKLKLSFEVDLEIIGFNDGDPNGQHANTFGSIQMATSDRKLVVGVAGIKQNVRDMMHANRDYYIGKIHAVTVNDIMFSTNEGEPHSLFLPRMFIKSKEKDVLLEIRLDKTEADSFEKVVAQYEAAKLGANIFGD